MKKIWLAVILGIVLVVAMVVPVGAGKSHSQDEGWQSLTYYKDGISYNTYYLVWGLDNPQSPNQTFWVYYSDVQKTNIFIGFEQWMKGIQTVDTFPYWTYPYPSK